VDELKGSDMSVGDQRSETHACRASSLLKRRGRSVRARQTAKPEVSTEHTYWLYGHGGLMTANCLWCTGELRAMSCMSCARLPHQARQTHARRLRLQLQRRAHGQGSHVYGGLGVDDEGCYRPRRLLV
jgi:hypothetical protein